MSSSLTTAPVAIFDRSTVRKHRNRAVATLDQHNFLFSWALSQIEERRADIKRDLPLTLQIGARPQTEIQGTDKIIYMDIAEKLLQTVPGNTAVQAEEEFLPFADNSFDMVISPLALHSVNDLPGALVQINRVLKPDGVFLGALLGGETLHELRHSMMQAELSIKDGASPRIAPFADMPQIAALMQRAGFALPVVDGERVNVTYEHPFYLMRDLRMMGENNALSERPRRYAGKKFMAETARLYQEHFPAPDEPNRVTATFDAIFMIGWAPHTSQQKPLRPGSADRSLAEALETEEYSTGDTAKP